MDCVDKKEKSDFTPIIGLEIHIELKTNSKMFCSCPADWFGKKPNTLTCPVCLGLPGALPFANEKAIEMTVLLGLAMNLKINAVSRFDRKHYFYPDLPKGYQISQYDQPIAYSGQYPIFDDRHNPDKKIGITRIHLEEDTGKLIHRGQETLVDFNRSGVPLLELVTEPDFRSSEEVKSFLEDLQTLVRYLGISDADMEKGSMRLEPNISLMNHESWNMNHENKKIQLPNYKVEVKNINSFRFAKRAIDYEVERQARILLSGKTPVQETRGWDEKRSTTFSQRIKEEAQDYRYFPEPDLPGLIFTDKYLDLLKKTIPELPNEKFERFIVQYGLNRNDAWIISRSSTNSQKYEFVLQAILQKPQFSGQENLAVRLASSFVNKKITFDSTIEQIESKMLQILGRQKMIGDDHLMRIIEDAVIRNPKPVEDFKAGKHNAIMFIVGLVMGRVKGKADPKTVKEMIIKKITK